MPTIPPVIPPALGEDLTDAAFDRAITDRAAEYAGLDAAYWASIKDGPERRRRRMLTALAAAAIAGNAAEGAAAAPEFFGVSSIAEPVSFALGGGTSSFVAPAPQFDTGSGQWLYNGLTIGVDITVLLTLNIDASAHPSGVIEVPVNHCLQVGIAPTARYLYSTLRLTFAYDNATPIALSNFRANIRGEMFIPSEAFVPDGVAAIEFDDTLTGLGILTPTHVGGIIPVTVDTALSMRETERIWVKYHYNGPLEVA